MILTGNSYFTQFSRKITVASLLLTFFHMFTQLMKFCTFHYYILRNTGVSKR